MRYAIVESGGKQYRAVEGEELEVDRLAAGQGDQISLERVLMVADGADFMVGTPTLSGIELRATVVDHVAGRKVNRFRYSPKKRIRVRGGHRQQYTRLLVDFIGNKGESRKPSGSVAQASDSGSVGESAAEPAATPPAKATPKKAATKKVTAKRPAVAGKTTSKKPST